MNAIWTKQRENVTAIMTILSLLGLTGCIMYKSGGGPVGRADASRITGHDLSPATQEQKEAFVELDQAKKEWLKEMPSLVSSGCGNSTGIKTEQKNNLSFGKLLLCGWWPSRANAMERVQKGDRSETFCREDTQFIPGYPLIWPVWTTWSSTYVQSSGQQVGSSSLYGLGLGCVLGGKATVIAPATLDFPAGKTPEQYDVFKIWFLAAGLVGGGRVNHTYYGQLLWTAFPVGSAD